MKDFLDKIAENSINYFYKFREFSTEIFGPILPWVKVIAIIISFLLLIGIIYTVVRSGYVGFKIERWIDIFGVGDIGRRRQLRIWKQIRKLMKSKEMSNWKKAIMGCDAVFDEILKASGYRGKTVHERFKQLPSTAISNYEKMMAAHRVRDRVMQEPDFTITQEDAAEVVGIYEQAFSELGLID